MCVCVCVVLSVTHAHNAPSIPACRKEVAKHSTIASSAAAMMETGLFSRVVCARRFVPSYSPPLISIPSSPFPLCTLTHTRPHTDDGSLPMIKLGDASAAAPFTAKTPSIAAAQDIIRQVCGGVLVWCWWCNQKIVYFLFIFFA